jgi:hypothetical protein
MDEPHDKIYRGQLRFWNSGFEWGGSGPFTVIGFREEPEPLAEGEEPDVWVECLIEDGTTDEFHIDEIIMGSQGLPEEND